MSYCMERDLVHCDRRGFDFLYKDNHAVQPIWLEWHAHAIVLESLIHIIMSSWSFMILVIEATTRKPIRDMPLKSLSPYYQCFTCEMYSKLGGNGNEFPWKLFVFTLMTIMAVLKCLEQDFWVSAAMFCYEKESYKCWFHVYSVRFFWGLVDYVQQMLFMCSTTFCLTMIFGIVIATVRIAAGFLECLC